MISSVLADVTGSIPVYVYTSNNLAKDAPIFIYFHGGGMVVGCRENVETTCQIISTYDLFLTCRNSVVSKAVLTPQAATRQDDL